MQARLQHLSELGPQQAHHHAHLRPRGHFPLVCVALRYRHPNVWPSTAGRYQRFRGSKDAANCSPRSVAVGHKTVMRNSDYCTAWFSSRLCLSMLPKHYMEALCRVSAGWGIYFSAPREGPRHGWFRPPPPPPKKHNRLEREFMFELQL